MQIRSRWAAPSVGRLGLCVRLVGLCMALALGAGCTAATVGARVPVGYGSVYGYTVVDAGGVPYDIYNYPSYYWNGQNAYLVGSSWYYPYGGGWVVFQDEPRDLYRYRRSLPLQVAPPAVQYREYRDYPAYRGRPRYRAPDYRTYPYDRYDRYDRSPRYQTRPPVQTAPPAIRRPADVQVAPPAVERPTIRRGAEPDVIRPPSSGGSRWQSTPPPSRSRVQSAPPAPR